MYTCALQHRILLCTAKFEIPYPSIRYNDKNIDFLLHRLQAGIHGIHFTGPAEANAFYSSYLNTRARKEEEHGSAVALFYFARRHEKRVVFIFQFAPAKLLFGDQIEQTFAGSRLKRRF